MRSYAMPEQKKFAVAAAYLALCVIWSSTWLAIKVGLQDLPPISFVALRFAIAVAVLLAISVGRVRLLPVAARRFQTAGLHGRAHVRGELCAAFLGGAVCVVRFVRGLAGDHSNFRDGLRSFHSAGRTAALAASGGSRARDRRRRGDLLAPAGFRRAPRFLGRSRRRVRRGERGVLERVAEKARRSSWRRP